MSAPEPVPARRPRPVTEADKPQRCEKCVESAKERKTLRARVAELEAQSDRLTRAIQRESHFIDKRAGHDGSRYMRKKEE